MKHTQEPWETSKHGTPDAFPQFGIYSGNRNDHATIKGDNASADADRIVACVNACAGIEDPAAELARLRRVEDAARAVVASAPEVEPEYEDWGGDTERAEVWGGLHGLWEAANALRAALED